jgi:hypothetical protein
MRTLKDILFEQLLSTRGCLVKYGLRAIYTEQLVHVFSSADVAGRLMLIAKRDKWQLVVKT